ncbi:CaiB/BaiF CoA transferase family protein [Novosphingobium album (ex Liu et al. 2023)]|uniref:CoA transferase n=1 Tax=Novosphingobium album (ex Liu et al. 2023) TaxID=3031130 RepID=A0ABT5WR39_9SPHN|nr:CoA transferase [Novosphingobium album (ex Liu et al. 2023)]MDE8652522.1 CoA transferase [Novosphingobium album (ex Liu et al. 2023)]
MAKPLAGLRIADFTVHNAGPFCTHLLSQLGAEVIKIESAMRPDAFRKPHPVYGRMGPATFDQVASTKLSVRINLKKPEGIALAKRIVGLSDVAAESFRPGVMGRLGLGYDVLKAVKPDIVMLSVSSSGQSGPDSHFAGYAPLFGAWGGLGALTGYEDGPPVEIRHVMDHTVGMNAAMAVMAALHRRRATGRGTHLDVAARDVASSLVGEALLLAAAGGAPGRMGNAHARMAPHGVYPASGEDRWIAIAVAGDAQWHALAQAMGRPELSADPRFATAAARNDNQAALDEAVAAWTSTQDANAAAETLQAHGIAAHASWTTPELAGDAHLRARKAIVDVVEPDGTVRAAVGVPMRLSKGADVGIHRGTPKLGEHEDHVYGELLGMDRAERRRLEEAEIIY